MNRTVIRNSLSTVFILVSLIGVFRLSKKKLWNFEEGSQVLNSPNRVREVSISYYRMDSTCLHIYN